MSNIEKLPSITDSDTNEFVTGSDNQEVNNKPFVLPEFTEHAVNREQRMAELLSKIRQKIG